MMRKIPKVFRKLPKAYQKLKKTFQNINVRNCLRTDSLDEFYSLWKMEHTPHGHIEAPAREPVPEVGTKQCTKAAAKKHTETIQLSLFD